MSHDRSHALDHVVLVLFENRSLDNLLGRLYGPEDGKTFEGVIGKGLSNPIPEWAKHGAERKSVPCTVATDMDAPNPDSGEEYFHTNTQLFNVLEDHNRFKIGEQVAAPWNAPEPGAVPSMDGFVTDYISTFTASWAVSRPTRSMRRSWPATRRNRCRCSAGSRRALACSTTGSARFPRRR